MKKIFLIFAIIFYPFLANAKEWKIIEDQSRIEFFAKQNDTVINGNFKKFGGTIIFDKNQLKNNKVEIEIDMTSLQASLSDAMAVLKTSDWLDLAKYPKAKFLAQKFIKVSEDKFKSVGTLEIKGVKAPIAFEFSFDKYGPDKATALGSFIIKRSDFLIGAKDPANAHGVKDEVEIKFTISAN